MSNTKTIRWLLDHEPIELFVRTAEAFDKEIQRLTNGELRVEVTKLKDFEENTGSDSVNCRSIEYTNTNVFQATQVETKWIGHWWNPDFFALEMPFLFKDHEHADRVFNGPIGKRLLNQVTETSNVKALAFTYSGGYRVFATEGMVACAEDLQGLTCLTHINPVRVDTAKAFGCNVVTANPQEHNVVNELIAQANSVETTLPRFKHEAYDNGMQNIGITDHSMFLTTILFNKDFLASLTTAQQEAIAQAANHVAALERQWTVDEAAEFAADVKKQKEMSVNLVRFADSEVAKLKEMSKSVYVKYSDFFTANLLDEMLAA
jgi:TRAP-type C4-dicarboxylate transport system substrate-binding protein